MKISKILKRFFIILSFLVIIFSVIKLFSLGFDQKLFESLKIHKKNPLCEDCNIIMISLDTLGAKHLPCYGYFRDTTPNLCKFAKDNILFQNAFSNASWTLPSHVSMFTSLYPSYHNVIYRGDVLSPQIPFLPEILQNNGYETYFYLPGNDTSLPIKDVYSRGITEVIPSGAGYGQPVYFNDALNSFLANVKEGKKTFTFLHTYAVHPPYFLENNETIYTKDNVENIPLSSEQLVSLPLTEDFYQFLLSEALQKNPISNFYEKVKEDPIFYEKFKNAKTLEEAEKIVRSQNADWVERAFIDYYFSQRNINTKRQVEYLQAMYDQRINELDDFIGKTLIPFLENPAIKDNTMVIVTSDHGEEFMEHGSLFHQTLYDPNTRVVLIFSVPGVTNKTITAPAQSVDIVPTILDIVGIPSKEYLFQGYSLVDPIQKNSQIKRLLFAEGFGSQAKTVRKDNWKLFLAKEGERYLPYELYDIKADPEEKNNILSGHMDIVNEIKNESDAYEQKWFRLLPFGQINQ